MNIGQNQRREPNLHRPERASAPATWKCPNPACRAWVCPSQSRDWRTCDQCGTPMPDDVLAGAIVPAGAL